MPAKRKKSPTSKSRTVSRGKGRSAGTTDSAGEITSRGTYSSTSYTESETRMPAGARVEKKSSRTFKPKGT